MEWYWWALIGVGVVIIGYIKIKVLQKMRDKSKK
jgi:hypothetical protein